MAPRKKRPVLYEVVSRSQRGRSWKPSSRGGTTTESPAPPTTEPQPTPRAAPAPATPPPARPTDAPRSARFADGRLYLVLGWPHLAVAAVLLFAVVIASFQAGQRSTLPPVAQDANSLDAMLGGDADRPPADEPGSTAIRPGGGSVGPIRTPLNDEAVTHVDPPPTADKPPGPAAEDPSPAPPAFRDDRYYVRVQCFPKRRRTAADQARDYLRSHGVPCTVVERPADLALVALEPFASQQQAQSLVRRVRELGKEYFTIAGYDFGGCEPKKF